MKQIQKLFSFDFDKMRKNIFNQILDQKLGRRQVTMNDHYWQVDATSGRTKKQHSQNYPNYQLSLLSTDR